ncbi:MULTISPECIES: class I adenylate-forming enzyme family protein [unclassified Micromonospora]|uniref:class I adenylate-forming enzyme family protein n=1 Tax=unclassified Micromonospora TaxID=2617518 RepID=UPI001C5DD786|nr:class I adenylate-forming enzyme family protein [Micromonospora sp. RL09-050-HVF-A]MBW4704211.1 acyl--CoA ligase [Micromonospora sp. RL09-050-HVF-A]
MLIEVIDDAARRHGDRPAVSDRQTTLTYRELIRSSAVWADTLAGLLPGGDRGRIGIRAGNGVAYVVAYLAALRCGAVPFLIDRVSGVQETAAIREDCGLDLLVHDSPAPGWGTPRGELGTLTVTGAPSAGRAALDPQTEVCRFTSGSTGRPHCIEFRGQAVHRAAVNWATGTGLDADDSIACFASLSNGLAFNTSLLSAFLVGARLHLPNGLPSGSAVGRAVAACAATRLVGFPALYDSLVRRPVTDGSFSRLRMAISSAAPLDPGTKHRFVEATGVPLRNYFGAAEAGPLTFATDPLTDLGLGGPLPGVLLRAGTRANPGPVEVRSESMGTRYLNAPGLLESRMTDDGHYRTGDRGYLADGSLFLSGRSHRVINVGGRKIDATEVVEALRAAAGVRDAVVLQVLDRHGVPALAAVLAADDSLDPSGPRRFLAGRLAPYKIPSLVRVVPEIPRGSAGKPAMAALEGLFAVDRTDG